MDKNLPLKLKREEFIVELIMYIKNISKYEQSNKYLKSLIQKSKKRHKKAINFMIKG